MAANPQSFFRFAARYYPLLLDLFYRREGFTEADLRNLIEGIASEGDPNPSTVIDQLLSFCIINHLWSRYLEPLRDLIDVKKAMDASLDDLDRSLNVNGRTFALDGALAREFSRCRARLLRLRREMTEDFYESIREVELLYISLKKESELVRGASLALEKLDRAGLASLHLQEMMAIPVWRIEGTFSDTSLEAFLHGIKGYQPGISAPLTETGEITRPEFILPSELYAQLEAALPVDDLLAWLLQHYPEVGLGELVRAYGRVFLRDLGMMHFGEEERRYPLPEATLVARPMRMERIS